jgi:hypothetical protein
MIVPLGSNSPSYAIAPLLLLGAVLAWGTAPATAESPANELSFETDVRPILKARCFPCHGEEPKLRGGLDLRLVRTMLKGGRSGEALVPSREDESLIWEKLEADAMPPGEKKLSSREKATIAAWIRQGAKTVRPEPESLPPGPVFSDEERAFWSFQPIRRPEVPHAEQSDRTTTPIDAFLLQKLERAGLSFSPKADRHILIRRASFDLLGLPPTPEDVDAFVNDPGPDAYERLIDRLLASPHYGERAARRWLDVAGYADSDGDSAKDAVRPYAYKYRDYLIEALNADRPWDELIREQLAGDEMLKPPYKDLSPSDRDKLVATGFLRTAPDSTADPGADASQARDDVIADTIKVVSTSLLGLSVGCAQCHAHRYDPISHEDYFRFRAVFEPAYDPAHWRSPAQRLISLWQEPDRQRAAEADREIREIEAERKAKIEELVGKVLERELNSAPEELRSKLREARDLAADKRSDEQKELLKIYPRVLVSTGSVSLFDAKSFNAITAEITKKVTAANAKRPVDDYAQALTEIPGQVPTTHLHERGDPKQPKQAVGPGELSILASTVGAPQIVSDDPDLPTTGRRLAYANHLTRGRHPLVSRVLVNRFWMHHFGKGLVASPSDFGSLGERPTHPELLDWLADELIRSGWRLKTMHKLIMTSSAYRQASRRAPRLDAIDPDNRLLGRMSVRRLEAEELRDAILAASGRLNATMLGPPLPVALDESGQVLVGIDTRDSAGRQNGKPRSLDGAEFRRSLYVQIRRSMPLSFTEAFDPPTLSPNCDRRTTSTVAPQSLSLMNNEFVTDQSEVFADRVCRSCDPSPDCRVRLAWRLALGREPSPEQVRAAVQFLADQANEFASADEVGNQAPDPKNPKPTAPKAPPDRRALATFCQALLGSNAFLYVD